jgi:hypothetical protein
LTDATNVALGVGAVGLGMSAIAFASSDGTTGDRVLGGTFFGVGVAALGTAGILYALDANPEKGIKVTAGPGMLGVRGSF